MRYRYSALGPERFQEFCQALLLTTFPNAQCLPVGQPDGGRDAFTRLVNLSARSRPERSDDKIVFQVKFSRSPGEDREEREFLQSIIEAELPKITKLKTAGLAKYYLLTNIGGTAHLDVGSIDRLNAFLTKELGVDAHCWWRDDLDRRLDNNPGLKWSYPELLSATDLLQVLMAGRLGDAEERRQSAIRAYIASQYEDDEELKFKQVELQSKILDLFVDLPIAPAPATGDAHWDQFHPGIRARRWQSLSMQQFYFDADDLTDLAGHYFLNDSLQLEPPRIVLEGAPGQGKSTVTQFICQVMRMHLLGKSDDLSRLPIGCRNAPVRLPFRVDLRDFAKWHAGSDPFQPKPVALPSNEPRSLEGFLAAQVRFESGGHEFDVSDLAAVIKASHVLIALDGFDEVAEVDIRKQLIQEVTKAIKRLESSGSFSVQVIVTSRPVAFAKSAGFPRDEWHYFELLPLGRPQVDEYATKWMKAKNFKESDKASFRRTLDSKLGEPHTQFLARNPMQLTILLAVVYTRGAALPEKRTAMYDAYMELFFSRESEKSEIVKEHRELLIDIHRFLAWQLQTAAEGGASGSIEHDELRKTLVSYLASQGEETTLVDNLFSGVVERVGALVSRVQETYEFEVQPLREYFAARYLYETAPYSPAGAEKAGTKLERFDALARNPYWLNVARFYAGCFSKGEISALVDALSEIAKSEPYEFTSHPRALALMLLGDWVFTQYQPTVRRVVALICEWPRMRQLLSTSAEFGPTTWAALPDRCGKADFVDRLFERLVDKIFRDERSAIATALIATLSVNERIERWMAIKEKVSHPEWVEIGDQLNILVEATDETLLSSLGDLKTKAVIPLIQNDRFRLLSLDPDLTAEAEKAIWSGARQSTLPTFSTGDPATVLLVLSSILNVHQYGYVLSGNATLAGHQMNVWRDDQERNESKIKGGLTPNQFKAVAAYYSFIEQSFSVLSTSLKPWSELVETLRNVWGDAKAIDRIAIAAAGVHSKDDVGSAPAGIFEEGTPLVERMRFARLKSGAPRWWEAQLDEASSSQDIDKLLLVMWTWATLKTVFRLDEKLTRLLDDLDQIRWRNLSREFAKISNCLRFREEPSDLDASELARAKALSPRMIVFIGRKISWLSRYELVTDALSRYQGRDEVVEQFIADAITRGVFHEGEGRRVFQGGDTKEILRIIKASYLRGAQFSQPMRRKEPSLGVEDAVTISRDPASYPLVFVREADALLQTKAGAGARSLLDVATSEAWFASTR
jgi:hypothetical protein